MGPPCCVPWRLDCHNLTCALSRPQGTNIFYLSLEGDSSFNTYRTFPIHHTAEAPCPNQCRSDSPSPSLGYHVPCFRVLLLSVSSIVFHLPFSLAPFATEPPISGPFAHFCVPALSSPKVTQSRQKIFSQTPASTPDRSHPGDCV